MLFLGKIDLKKMKIDENQARKTTHYTLSKCNASLKIDSFFDCGQLFHLC